MPGRRADDPEARAATAPGVASAPRELARLQRLRDDLADLVLVEGLGDEVERAALERLDGGVDGAVRGDEHDRQLGLDLERALEQRHPVDLRHLQVGDDEIDVVLAQQVQTLLAVLGRQHVVAVARELGGEDLPQVRLVVDDQDLLALGKHAPASLPSSRRAPVRFAAASRQLEGSPPPEQNSDRSPSSFSSATIAFVKPSMPSSSLSVAIWSAACILRNVASSIGDALDAHRPSPSRDRACAAGRRRSSTARRGSSARW